MASRVWVEEWTTLHARFGEGLAYPDELRARGYPALRSEKVAHALGLLMATPAAWMVGNDLFALAWRIGEREPPSSGRFRPVRRYALTRRPVKG